MSENDLSTKFLKKLFADLIILCGLTACLIYTFDFWVPFKRGFFCDDESLMFPYNEDTVTSFMLQFYGLSIPTVFFLICEYANLRNENDKVMIFGVPIPTWIRGFYYASISFYIGFLFEEITVGVAKNVIGRPRPYFFQFCKPSVNCSLPEWQGRYVEPSEYTCTSGKSREELKEMRISFLSGHSAMSSYTMLFLVLYLQKRMTWRVTRFLRHLLQFVAVMLSWFTALSRISDFKHHWSDVLAGYSVGILTAILMWTFGTDLVQKKKEPVLPLNDVTMTIQQIKE